MKRIISLVVLVVLLGGGWTITRLSAKHDDKPVVKALSTVAIKRSDLTSTESVSGTLSYANSGSIVNYLSGTVTSIPAAGTTITNGQTLYDIDNRPVVLMKGDTPAWRDFKAGMSDGVDVRQLEQALVDLGYAKASVLTVDNKFTSATADAIKRWQKANGLDQTGVIERGRVVFEPGDVRVVSAKATLGSPAAPGSPVLDITSTERIVHVDLATSKQRFVAVGQDVDVDLLDGNHVHGKVKSVAPVATASTDKGSTTSTIGVDITLDASSATTGDQIPVNVSITTDSRKAVLVVPINALLALAEGGYAVQVVDGTTSHLVKVDTGLFADSQVEVSGDGLQEGTNVEVPAS